MNFNDNSNLEAKERNLLTLGPCTRWTIMLLAIFVCLVPTSTAFGYSYYSDEWIDDSDPTNVRMVGTGVTYDPDNGYMGTPHGYQQIHSYWVAMTLTSPSGRTVSLNSNHTSSYASSEGSLPLLVNGEYEIGNYTTQTQHWMCCPYMQPNPWDGQRCYPSASSFVGLLISLKKSSWLVIGEGPASCLLEATCSGTCVTIGAHHTANKIPGTSCSSNGLYFQLYELYADGQCWPSTRWGSARMFEGECD